MAKAAAPWPLYARLLPALPAFLFYLVITSCFPNATQVNWQPKESATNVPARTAGSVVSSSSNTHAATTAAAVSSSQATDAAIANAAIAAAAKQPVVIGLQRSGQWPFWQAMHAPDRIGDLGVRAKTHMQGPVMGAQHPDWVSAQQMNHSTIPLWSYMWDRCCQPLVQSLPVLQAVCAM
jgi:hypothetical protein